MLSLSSQTPFPLKWHTLSDVEEVCQTFLGVGTQHWTVHQTSEGKLTLAQQANLRI